MRVLQLNSEMGLRGGEQQLLLLADGLRSERPDVETSVACHPKGALARAATEAGLPVVPLAMGAALDWRSPRQLRAWLAANPVDLLHAHTAHAHGVVARAVRPLGAGRPRVVVTRHVAYSIFRHSFLRLNRRKYVAGCDRIVCVSGAVRDVLRQDGIPEDRLVVVPNGIDLAAHADDPAARHAIRSDVGAGDDALLVGAVGALTPEKGHGHLLDAFALLDPARRDARLVLVGDGPLRTHLEEHARGLGIQDHVVWAGHVADVPRWLAAFDVLAVPSEAEGFSLALAQGLASGLPVVASRVGGMPEVVGDDDAALLVPPGDAATLAATMARLLEEPALRERLGAAARVRARAFDHRATARATADVYDALLARG